MEAAIREQKGNIKGPFYKACIFNYNFIPLYLQPGNVNLSLLDYFIYSFLI